jgi:CheY-like chemotaxis protein
MKVLVADVRNADEVISGCLPGHELVFVRTMHEALRALHRDGYGLIVIELHFDESRMFELLEEVHGLERYRAVPVVCVQAIEVGLSEAVLKNIDVAVKALGGEAFLDLRDGAEALAEHCGALAGAAAAAGGGLRPN